MEFKPQSSFIPKKSVVDGGATRGEGIALFPLITTAIFIIALLVSSGIFGYNYFLKKNIETMTIKLQDMRKNFDPVLVANLSRTDKRIENAKKILDSHVSFSSVLKALEVLTAKTIRFTLFQFSNQSGQNGDSFDLTLEGRGKSYNAITFQSDAFLNEKAFKNITFYDLVLDDITGDVIFKVQMSVDPSFILYKNSLLPQEVLPSVTPTPVPSETPMGGEGTDN